MVHCAWCVWVGCGDGRARRPRRAANHLSNYARREAAPPRSSHPIFTRFATPSRLSRPLSPFRNLNTSRAAEDGRPYRTVLRQRSAGGGGGASSSILRVTLSSPALVCEFLCLCVIISKKGRFYCGEIWEERFGKNSSCHGGHTAAGECHQRRLARVRLARSHLVAPCGRGR